MGRKDRRSRSSSVKIDQSHQAAQAGHIETKTSAPVVAKQTKQEATEVGTKGAEKEIVFTERESYEHEYRVAKDTILSEVGSLSEIHSTERTDALGKELLSLVQLANTASLAIPVSSLKKIYKI